MSSIEEAIYSKLSGTAGITAIVPASRIYYLTLHDNAVLPAISYQRVGTNREYTLNEAMTMADAMIQIDVWSRTDIQMLQLGNLVRSTLDGFRGVVGGVTIERMLQVNEYDLKELDGTVYRRFQNFRVIFQEP